MSTVKADMFASTVQKLLDDYVTADVVPAMYETIDEVSKEAVKELKAKSPRGATKRYYKGWTRAVDKGRMTTEATIYGKSGTYQIAHLLENGHAKRNGGRWEPQKHPIAEVDEWVEKEVYDRVVRKLES